ncbi:penicillin-binding protein 2 [Aliiroseovarius sp. PTFE2010]|uniref:penicillin-binding protein 2 n=1 Tax=Aliiroseovarius sp. PTFE2010 TaxID=3417190 RepID=UPI003CF9F54C
MKRNSKDTDRSTRQISRRALLLGASQLAFMGGLALRMRYLQVDQADQYRLLAEENRVNIRLIPPARGLIYDRKGRIIGDNAQNYRITMVREDAGDFETTLAAVRKLVPISDDENERILRELRNLPSFVPVTIADRLSWEDVAEIAVNAPALPGVTPEVGLSRHYPFEEDFAHIVGYVGPVSDYDLSKIENPDPLLQIPKFQIGKVGVEAKLEADLRGAAGSRRIEVNAVGRVMRELDRIPGTSGADIQLTIDASLQNFVQQRMANESAAAVVMNPRNGDLLAMGSTPSFDPNKFVRGISVADYAELTENKYRPLANKSVQGTYPPGSTFKMITALAALDAGVVSTGETVYCPGHTTVAGRRFHCWKRAGHGWVDLNGSLKHSCDVYYYEMAQRVGIERISAMARKFGLGEKFDIPMSAVASGLAPTKEWKQVRRGQDWLIGDSLNASIGQGFVLASPLQLAVMAARLASGTAVVPRLVRSVDGVEQPVPEAPPLDIDENHLRAVRRAMYAVSNDRRGTAYRSHIAEDRFRMAGKTGTSQVRSVIVNNKEVPWEQRDHGLFVAFAPFDTPDVACSVVIEHGGGGSSAAAPVARDIVLQALYDGLPPLSAYPASQRGTIEARQKDLNLRNFDQAGKVQDRA